MANHENLHTNSKKASHSIFQLVANGFSATALILGFIVDAIAIISILFAIEITEQPITVLFTQIKIDWTFSFVIWVLAFYLYISWLHVFWSAHKIELSLEASFWNFLKWDLIREFRFPFRLLPGLGLIILLCWIVGFVTMIILVLLVGFILGTLFLAHVSYLTAEPSVKDKVAIEMRWEKFLERVKIEFTRMVWIHPERLNDLIEMWGLSSKAIEYGLTT